MTDGRLRLNDAAIHRISQMLHEHIAGESWADVARRHNTSSDIELGLKALAAMPAFKDSDAGIRVWNAYLNHYPHCEECDGP